jgi:hypothetical protein
MVWGGYGRLALKWKDETINVTGVSCQCHLSRNLYMCYCENNIQAGLETQAHVAGQRLIHSVFLPHFEQIAHLLRFNFLPVLWISFNLPITWQRVGETWHEKKLISDENRKVTMHIFIPCFHFSSDFTSGWSFSTVYRNVCMEPYLHWKAFHTNPTLVTH